MDIGVPVSFTPIRANEADTTFRTYTVDRFLVIVPDSVWLANPGSPAPRNVHVFFSANTVQPNRGNDVLTHGLRGACAPPQTQWITIGVHAHDHISDAEIQECLANANLPGQVVSLRLSAHSRGSDSLFNSIVGNPLITTLSILDRVTFLDDDGNMGSPMTPQLVAKGVSASVMVAYEVNVHHTRTPGVRYIGLRSAAMSAIGYVRLIQDAMVTQDGVAALVNANKPIVAQLDSVKLPPRGSFTTKGAPGLTSLQQFCADNAGALQVILTNQNDGKKGLLAFLNANDLARFRTIPHGRKGDFLFDQGISAHHFFAAEVAHELIDSWLPTTDASGNACAPNNPCVIAAPQ